MSKICQRLIKKSVLFQGLDISANLESSLLNDNLSNVMNKMRRSSLKNYLRSESINSFKKLSKLTK